MRFFVFAIAISATVGCRPTKQAAPLRSLESSGRAAFLCWGADDQPRSVEDCPDQIPYDLDAEHRDWIALVTQTTRGEVAVVNVSAGTVVDTEPSVPGYNFLTIGQNPVSIVSTPGSVASFVAVAEVGKEGIYALPTSCVSRRSKDEPLRDILSWPACRLPSAPGEMALIVDPETSAGVRLRCDDTTRVSRDLAVSDKQGEDVRDCPADLAKETMLPGRRKLLVALPSRSLLAVIDAQEILDRTPGSFDPCPIERYTRLRVDLPTTPLSQALPPDMQIAGCSPPTPLAALDPADFVSHPADFARDGKDPDGPLYVADLEAPVVHVLDTKDPCAIVEQPPLLPLSLSEPSRVVTTRRVALSPRTSVDKRFLYAVDELDGGSVMIFDVSNGSTERTPMVRPRSSWMPFEAKPDRIAFDAPVSDLAFVEVDRPIVDKTTGNTIIGGVECDPDPRNSTTPGAEYRPISDSSAGAQPAILRGVFGFLALGSGQLAVIDVEDLDAKCRRPETANSGDTENFQGCSRDDPAIPIFSGTVTDERSCHVIEPHRARSALPFRTSPDIGARSPGLLASPKLTDKSGKTLATDRTTQGIVNPRMLGVDFSDTEKAQVYVGTTLRERDPGDPLVEALDTNPATAEENSLVLNLVEPRAYARPEAFQARYEGPIASERTAARFEPQPDGTATLTDSGIAFCGTGVEDENVAAARAAELGVDPGSVSAFASAHADYVLITSDILDENDVYWQSKACGGAAGVGRQSYLACRSELGTAEVPLPGREFRVTRATASSLQMAPRWATSAEQSVRASQLLDCCFPGTVRYTLRASQEWVVSGSSSGPRHRIVADASGACIRDTCDPMKSKVESRAFEVSCAAETVDPTDPTGTRKISYPATCPTDEFAQGAIGKANPGESACVLPYFADRTITPVLPGAGAVPDVLQRCIFRGLTARFVVYRGAEPSKRDMTFAWEVAGSFAPFTVNLAVSDSNIAIQSLELVPYLNQLAMTDGAFQGLLVMDLVSLVPRSYY